LTELPGDALGRGRPPAKENAVRLFSLGMPWLSKPKAFPASVLVDEFDSGSLQGGSDCFQSSRGNLSPVLFEVDNRRQPEVGRVRKLQLRDFQ